MKRWAALAACTTLAACGGSTAGTAPVLSNLTLSVVGDHGGAIAGQLDAMDPTGMTSPVLELTLLDAGGQTILTEDAVVDSAAGQSAAQLSFLLEIPANNTLPPGNWTLTVTLSEGGLESNTLTAPVP